MTEGMHISVGLDGLVFGGLVFGCLIFEQLRFRSEPLVAPPAELMAVPLTGSPGSLTTALEQFERG